MRFSFGRESRTFNRNRGSLRVNINANFLGSLDNNLSCSFVERWAHRNVANSSRGGLRAIVKSTNSRFCSVNKIVKNDNVAWCDFLFQAASGGGGDDMAAVENLQSVNVRTVIDVAR